jgi:hypothetical protein
MICGPCRVPLSSGIGMAKIRLSYPGWKVGKVTPVTIEVPIEPLSWPGLFWGYLIWPLVTVVIIAVITAVGWIVWRAWRYIARLRSRPRV